MEPLDPVNEGDTVRYTRTLGHKYLEMGNHLGNILPTVSDQKISVEDNGFMDYYLPKVVGHSDYYPFGMQMEGRSGGMDYRFGVNRQESDNEVSGTGNQYLEMVKEGLNMGAMAFGPTSYLSEGTAGEITLLATDGFKDAAIAINLITSGLGAIGKLYITQTTDNAVSKMLSTPFSGAAVGIDTQHQSKNNEQSE